MKTNLLIIFASIVFAACQPASPTQPQNRSDYLSSWFEQNEDSLYSEFIRQVQATALCATCDTSWGTMVYQTLDSATFMGRFSLEAGKYCHSIQVSYFYNRQKAPQARILLSVNYNRQYARALDTILNSITPKYFAVNKYEQADTSTDIIGITNADVVVKDLRLELTPIDSLKRITVWIHARPKDTIISNESGEYLTHLLWGEELLLKKIEAVRFRFSDTLNNTLPTLNQVRSQLKRSSRR